MLCTSIVSGIDAGPSPRVCCNGYDYKNLYGSLAAFEMHKGTEI